MGLRTSLDILENRKYFFPASNQKSFSSLPAPKLGHYNVCAISLLSDNYVVVVVSRYRSSSSSSSRCSLVDYKWLLLLTPCFLHYTLPVAVAANTVFPAQHTTSGCNC